MKMVKSVADFGARGDGVHDDYAAIQAALDCGAGEIIIPQGVYCVSNTLKVHSDTHIRADQTAKIVMKSSVRRKRNDFLLTNADTECGNTNIAITGGIWDGNNIAPENAKPDIFEEFGYSGTVLNFVHVDGLTLKNMVIANSVTYYVRMSRLHNFTIEDISFVSDHFGVNQDGLHFGGDVKHGMVKNIRALSYGQTNDDLIALNADDSIVRVENRDIVRDCIEDITFENIYAENCHTIIRMLSVTAAIRNIRFKNVYGGFRCYALNADAARYCRTPLFKEDEYPEGVGCISDIDIENFTCYPITELPKGFGGTHSSPPVAMTLESNIDNFRITGFRYVKKDGNADICPAMKMTNLIDEKVCADGAEYTVRCKSDVIQLADFTDLSIHKILR